MPKIEFSEPENQFRLKKRSSRTNYELAHVVYLLLVRVKKQAFRLNLTKVSTFTSLYLFVISTKIVFIKNVIFH